MNKTICAWLAVLFILTSSLPGLAEIRIVDGKRIDIDGTNSPWREIKITAIAPAQPSARLLVQVENEKRPRIIHLKRIPPDISAAFSEKKRLEDQITSMEARIKADTVALRYRSVNTASEAPVNSAAGRDIRAVNRAAADLTTATETLRDARENYLEASRRCETIGTDRAYFTGRKVGEVEIWDMGEKLPGR